MHAGQSVTAGLRNVGISWKWQASAIRVPGDISGAEGDFCSLKMSRGPEDHSLMCLRSISQSVLGYGDQRHAVHCDRVRKEWRNVR